MFMLLPKSLPLGEEEKICPFGKFLTWEEVNERLTCATTRCSMAVETTCTWRVAMTLVEV